MKHGPGWVIDVSAPSALGRNVNERLCDRAGHRLNAVHMDITGSVIAI